MAELLARLEARFDTKLEKGLTDLRDSLLAEMNALRTEMLTGMTALRTDSVTKEQFADFRSEVSDKFTDLLKWMVVLWTGTVFAVITTGIFT